MINIEPLLLKIKNRRLAVMLAPVVLGILVGGLLVVKPGLKRLNTLKSEIQGLKQKEQAYNAILESEKNTGNLKPKFAGDKTWLIEQLNTIAQATGFSILTISPDDSKQIGTHLTQTSVRIDAEGNYHQLGEFVSRAESLEAYVKILGANITNDTMGGGPQGPFGFQSSTRSKYADNVYNISLSVALFTTTPGTST